MSAENFENIATYAIQGQLRDLYRVCEEIEVLKSMLDELGAGGRNANDVYAIKAVADWLREVKIERAAIRRLIHEEPQLQSSDPKPAKTLGPKAAGQGGTE